MADTVLAVSWQPYRELPDGAIAIGANSLTMIAADRLRGCGSATAMSRAPDMRLDIRIEHSWRQANRRH